MEPLITELAFLYPTEAEARQIAVFSELKCQNIDFTGSASNFWTNILDEAYKTNKLDYLIEKVEIQFNRQGLDEAKENYKKSSDKRSVGSDIELPKGDIKLRSRRPKVKYPPPADFHSILFAYRDQIPLPIIEQRQWLETREKPLCLVAHYEKDVEYSLLQLEEAIEHGRQNISSDNSSVIWIKGHDVFSNVLGTDANGILRNDWLVIQHLFEPGADPQKALSLFNQLLEESELTFILDFSNLKIANFTGDNNVEKWGKIIEGIDAFQQNVISQGHSLIIGLPRLALSFKRWRSFTKLSTTCYLASALFDHLSALKLDGNKVPHLPALLEQAISPLIHSNSYALHSTLLREANRISQLRDIQESSIDQQYRHILELADKLYSAGYFDPALRLEIWCRTRETKAEQVLPTAYITPIKQEARDFAVGQLHKIYDLPLVSKRAVIIGESGRGKTNCLKSIERVWSLPREKSNGLKAPNWLPIYLDTIEGSSSNIKTYFQQNSTFSLLNDQELTCHSGLRLIANENNLPWLLGSPILFLIDKIKNSENENPIANWINKLASIENLSIGIVTTYRNNREVPFSQGWFLKAFEGGVEAEIKGLEQDDVVRLCSSDSQINLIKRLFSQVDTPLNTHVRTLFLTKCILKAFSSNREIPEKCSLFELLKVYVEKSVPFNDRQAVESYLSELAVAEQFQKDAVFPANSGNLSIRYGFLSSSNDKDKFKHPLLKDYFLTKYLCSSWSKAGSMFLEHLKNVPYSTWEAQYLNLLRMIIKELHPAERNTLIEFLMRFDQHQLAHRCLLELNNDEYQELPAAHELSAFLVNSLKDENNNQNLKKSNEQILAKRKITDCLNYYDPRIPKPEETLSYFVSVTDSKDLLAAPYLVTNLEFARFIYADGYFQERFWQPAAWSWIKKNEISQPAYWTQLELSRPNFPVVGVSIYEAFAYTKWLTEKINQEGGENYEISLPTEVEWSILAGLRSLVSNHPERKSTTEENQSFPADNLFNDSVAIEEEIKKLLEEVKNYIYDPITPMAAPIGLNKPLGPGIYDLFGNVWQWCDEWYELVELTDRPSVNHLSSPRPVLVKGGTVPDTKGSIASLTGGSIDPFSRVDNIGFRVICRLKPDIK